MTTPPLHIALNATAATHGGGLTYWLEILPALAGLETPHRFTVYTAAGQTRIGPSLAPAFRFRRIRFPRPAAMTRIGWEQAVLPWLLRREAVDVLLSPADMAPVLSRTPTIMGVQNANPYYGPQASTRGGVLRERLLRSLTYVSARRARKVFFISRDSKDRIAPILKLPATKAELVYFGVAPEFVPAGSSHGASGERPSHAPHDAYMLSVSAVRVHKNFETLLRAYSMLRGTSKAAPARLVIPGTVVDAPYYASLRRLVAELELDAYVEFKGEMSHEALPALYRGAQMFVLSSLTETFGHPLVEAMASGTPVLVSDLPVFREVCGDAAGYFPPGDAGSLAASMASLLEDPDLRRRRIARGLARAAEFSWHSCARLTLDLLEEAARSRPFS